MRRAVFIHGSLERQPPPAPNTGREFHIAPASGAADRSAPGCQARATWSAIPHNDCGRLARCESLPDGRADRLVLVASIRRWPLEGDRTDV
jgi:hypothetical protein